MPKPTQAHLDRVIKNNQPTAVKQKTLGQMQYYMGAKLLEVGIDPQSVTYRWSVKKQKDQQICILSAFWGESQEKLLSGKEPLTGEDLINCARGNGSAGVIKTAQLCGYSRDIESFKSALKQTISEMGLPLDSFSNLLDVDR